MAMRRNFSGHTLCAGLIGFSLLTAAPASWGAPGPAPSLFRQAATLDEVSTPLMPGRWLTLFPLDDSPQAGRTPLILIHGILAEKDRWCRWDRFLKYVHQSPALRRQFKVYLVRYDSSQGLPLVSSALRDELRGFLQASGGQPVNVIAYSEGGLLIRNAMQDPEVFAGIRRVLTVGTPFHGSPLASRGWMQQQFRKMPPLSAIRLTEGVSYWLAGRWLPSFRTDFEWDNFDHALDTQDDPGLRGRGPLQGYLAAGSPKLMTYGSYFGEEPEQDLSDALGLTQTLPRERLKLTQAMSPHLWFRIIQAQMARLPLPRNPQPGPAAAPPLSMMAYNDGIAPISSTLWLGRFLTPAEAGNGLKSGATSMWAALQRLRGQRVARLFPALDHRDWLEGSTRAHTAQVPDLLHPEQPARTVFDWFLLDLTQG